MDDKALQDCVGRAKAGDAEAMGELFKHFWRAARAAAYGVTGDFSLAEDAASEGFCQALEGLQGLRDPLRFGPWLRTIVIRAAQRLGTKQHATTETVSLDCLAAEPERSLEERELMVLVQEAVGRLPEALREAISLFYFEGYDTKEAARFLDVPMGTLKRRLHEGRRQLTEVTTQLLEGKTMVDAKREAVLKELRHLATVEADEEAFLRVFYRAIKLRPLPVTEISALWRRRHKKLFDELKENNSKRQAYEDMMKHMIKSSERALAPEHPVGNIARRLLAALPEFREWQMDVADFVEGFIHGKIGRGLPPGFVEGQPGAYIGRARGMVALRPDGTVLHYTDMADMSMEARRTIDARMSDTFDLMWLREGGIELHSVEELVQRLVDTVLPQAGGALGPYEEPRYRVALRYTVPGQTIPLATGGVFIKWPEMAEQCDIAHLRIYLEPWAAVASGQTIELLDMVLPDKDQ